MGGLRGCWRVCLCSLDFGLALVLGFSGVLDWGRDGRVTAYTPRDQVRERNFTLSSTYANYTCSLLQSRSCHVVHCVLRNALNTPCSQERAASIHLAIRCYQFIAALLELDSVRNCHSLFTFSPSNISNTAFVPSKITSTIVAEFDEHCASKVVVTA
jgi:hypothetical protein